MIKTINLLSIALLFFWQASVAQDTAVGQATSEPNDLEEQVTDEQQANDPEISNTDVDNQVFIPSEEISEDAPVAFPVDI